MTVVDTPRAAAHNGRLVSALKVYRLMLAISIVLNLIVGIYILFWPDHFAMVAGQPEAFPKTWPRHWGMQLWAINFLYLPGLWNPEQNRWPNWCGIAIRFTFAAKGSAGWPQASLSRNTSTSVQPSGVSVLAHTSITVPTGRLS